MMGTAQFARILVLDIGWACQSIGGATLAALHGGGFSFRNSHDELQYAVPPNLATRQTQRSAKFRRGANRTNQALRISERGRYTNSERDASPRPATSGSRIQASRRRARPGAA